ncbi:Gfo/Idh/MocA family oxidoreductase [Clostridium minihomine]|uniref:Gfo/Idh/MocA family oxidoreductase n=1 Tax=Clostridium minihomine TaxID=2045012 RepID=UPI000C7948BA|nr:Gfo/Idh/MocA family oxidoreductase [Clostridium minihomine]
MKKLKFGIIGVGRLGYEHASNIAFRVPGAELVAICDANYENAKKVAAELGVKAVYQDPKKMCADPEVEAVAIVTNTDSHVEMLRIAMEAGKHVFCEKPLADTVEKCKQAEKIIEAHPNQIFMLGFMRRYDYSYRVAKQKIDNGDIGDVILVRCYSQDPISIIEGTLEYAPRSGGQFIDMSIHDIDLIRWLTNSEPRNLWAMGGCYEFKQYKDWDDGDNVSCLMQCENDAMAFFFAGRAAAHGSHVETEIIGTRGTLRIAAVPTNSLVEVMSEHGVCRECYQDFISRWHDAYITEIAEFCDCVENERKAAPGVYDGTKSTNIAFRCKESFKTGKMLSLT